MLGKLKYAAMFIVHACSFAHGHSPYGKLLLDGSNHAEKEFSRNTLVFEDGYDQTQLSKQPSSALDEAAAPTTTDFEIAPSVSSGLTPYAYGSHATQDRSVFEIRVMILPEQIIAPNSHWEYWTVPEWFHAPNVSSDEYRA